MSTNTVTPTPAKNEKSKWSSRPRTQGSTGSSSRGSKKSKYGKKQGQRKGQKPVTPRAPTKEYISTCCNVPSVKPKAGRKETAQDPESKKTKEVTKGLGHWRCGECGKPCKVKVQMPTPKVEVPANNVAISVEAPVENVATLLA